MDYFDNKKNETVKEEGELTDDDDENGSDEGGVLHSKHAYLNRINRESSRYFSAEQNRNIETRNNVGNKRKVNRRRAETDSRRSSRNTADGGHKKYHREYQDSREASVLESHTPSKFWANRRFRASSVRPLSPKHTKLTGPRRNDSPQSHKHRGQDITTEEQDELERLEMEQKRIREQLKSLEAEEEEEQNEGSNENECVLESLNARSHTEDLVTPCSGTSKNSSLNYLLEEEKIEDDDDDIDLQELRRLALATSERHIRLMATEPHSSQQGVADCDVVVIPDIEPDLPEPEVVLVDEEEEEGKKKDLKKTASTPKTSLNNIIDTNIKKKSKKSGKFKKKHVSNNNKSSVHDKERSEMRSKVVLSSPKKSKEKKRKRGDVKKVDELARQREELRILVMNNPTEALEKLLKFANEWEGPQKPILTGTIKDFKRQKQMPVLSDKQAVHNFSQKTVAKKKISLEKSKELKEHDKKSGQLQDNYEEVEMDIDSGPDNEDESSNFGGLQFGEDFNQAMLPVSSYQTVNQPQTVQHMLAPVVIPPLPPQQFHISPSVPFEVIQPPIPPPIPPPPPPPPPPPSFEQDFLWEMKHEFIEDKVTEIMNDRLSLSKDLTSSSVLHLEDTAPVYHRDTRSHDFVNAPNLNKAAEVEKAARESNTFQEEINWPLHNSLDDIIGTRLRLIRQNPKSIISSESSDINLHKVVNVLPSGTISRYSSDDLDRTILQRVLPLTENSSYCEDTIKVQPMTEYYPSIYLQTADQSLLYKPKVFHSLHEQPHSPSLPAQMISSERTDINSPYDTLSEGDKYIDNIKIYSNSQSPKNSSYMSHKTPVRRIYKDRTPSPLRRTFFPGGHLRNGSKVGSSSPHSPTYYKAPLKGKHMEEPYTSSHRSPSSRSSSRDYLQDYISERSTTSSQYLSRKYEHEHWSSSPQERDHERSTSSERTDLYHPEAPPAKRYRRFSPPPYIPTSIRPTNSLPESQISKYEHHHHRSDTEEEEEDPAALRDQLLAEVIEKRKTTTELVSNNTTPCGMSPRQDSEPSDLFYVADLKHELSLDRPGTRFEVAGTVSQDDEEDDEDIKPPPVVNRVSRQLNKPPSLGELCRRELTVTERSHVQVESQYEEEHRSHHHPILDCLQTNFNMDKIFEENTEDLSQSDLDALKTYVIRAQARTPSDKKLQHSAAEDVDHHGEAHKKEPSRTYSKFSLKVLPDSDVATLSSMSESHLENDHLSSTNSLLNTTLKQSVPTTARSLPTADHSSCTTLNQDVRLATFCPVTSTNVSNDAGQPSLFLEGIKVISSASSPACSQTDLPFMSTEPSVLPSLSTSLQHPTQDLNQTSASTVPQSAALSKNSQHYSSSSLDLRLQATSLSNAEPVRIKPRSSLVANTTAYITQPELHLGFDHQGESLSSNISEVKLVSAAGVSISSGVNISVKRSAVSQTSAARTSVESQHSFNMRRGVNSDSLNISSLVSERPGLSTFSSQMYTSSVPARKYSNVHHLPVHPQVLVPMNASSGSDGEGDDDHVRPTISGQTLLAGEDLDVAVNTHRVLAQGHEKAAAQLLMEQEKILNNQEQSIQKDQKTVKLLVKRAVKFLEAQQLEEEKRELFRTQLLALSHKMKTSQKLVMLLKAEKEQTEKQVQLVTERLLHKKKLYSDRAKSIMSLGTKLIGPNYVPRTVKALQESTSHVIQNLTRAQRIAREKLKLMEKEKQIAEQLRKLKESKSEKDTGRLPTLKDFPSMLGLSTPKWKSQDVIKIDKDAKPDVSVQHRRKSLLEMSPSTTPNIPLSVRRSNSLSNTEKENIVSETTTTTAVEEIQPTDKQANTDLSSTFKMPTAAQLTNFCKLQREKTLKYLKHPYTVPVAGVCSYPNLTCVQTSTTMSKLKLQNNENKVRSSHDERTPFLNLSHLYTSPLLMFKSYRFNSYFRTKENLCLQSSTYSHKINHNIVMCPYDLQGTCNDDCCQQLHPRDYKFSDHELLEDIVSYCPRLAGATDDSSQEDVKTCIVNFVEKIISKHKGKMTIDDLCLWLSSQVNEASGKRHPHTVSLKMRVWRPQPKEETGLSLDLNEKLTNHKVEAINVDRKVTDKDSVVNIEDMRYFTADLTELLSLEASILADPTNTHLWLKLASVKLSDQNKSNKECLDQALSVLARGLEANRNDPDLWHMYLTLYRRYPEVKEFPEFCQTALEYAPSYELWFLYLDSLKTYSEKDEVCSQTLNFLSGVAREGRHSSSSNVQRIRKSHRANTILEKHHVEPGENPQATAEVRNKISEIQNGNNTVDGDEMMEANDVGEATVIKSKRDTKQGPLIAEALKNSEVGGDTEPERTDSKSSKIMWKKLSHQILEMVVYKISLNLHTGRVKTAIHFLQMVLGLKKGASSTLDVVHLVTKADLLVLWMVYIHVVAWHQLPQHLLNVANENPGRIMAKENITLSWSTKASLHTGVDSLLKLHDKATKVWETSEDDETTVYYVKLVQSRVSLLMLHNRHTEAILKCRSVLSHKTIVDVWLTTADVYASCNDSQNVKQVLSEALSTHRYSSKLQYYQCLLMYQQGETEMALRQLQQFVISHFDISSKDLLHCNHRQLYSQLLKQQEAFSLHTAQLKDGVSENLHKDIHMWLCYSLLMELEGRSADTVEIMERSLTHAQNPDDLILVWQNYLSYLRRSGTPPKEVRDIMVRSIISVPTKFPVPFSPLSPGAMWVNYYYSNKLVECWLTVLAPEDSLDFMEMCLSFMPNNVQLFLRAIDLCLDVKETRRAYSWCKFVVAQTDKPANLAFWKIAIALAHVEGTPREVELMLIDCVETMPLAVSAWKDFLLFEVAREKSSSVHKLLVYCQQLQLNIEGFVATLTAS